MTPGPKRAKMGSPDCTLETPEKEPQGTESAKPQKPHSEDRAPFANPSSTEATGTTDVPSVQPAEDEEEEELEADDGETDSAVGTDNSDSTSITSSIYDGIMENGRRYQSRREGEYWGPSDEKQFQSMQKCHILHYILDSQRENPSFYSPVPKTIQNILDIGTGTGDWARDVADRFPSALVQGVDLSPPPDTWVPPNCKFEVDDVLKPWEFKENGRFGLIHLRYMYGAFTDEQWRLLYKQAYKNLAPGGWIEQIEPSIIHYSDDSTMPADSVLASCGQMFHRCCARTGKNLDTEAHLKSRIEAAGFSNIHEKMYKVPIGPWAKSQMLKEAGIFHQAQLLEGAEGYFMFLLTHFGEPTPWTPDEVQAYLAKYKNEIKEPARHIYHKMRRVWAQKPYDTESNAKKSEPVVENVA